MTKKGVSLIGSPWCISVKWCTNRYYYLLPLIKWDFHRRHRSRVILVGNLSKRVVVVLVDDEERGVVDHSIPRVPFGGFHDVEEYRMN